MAVELASAYIQLIPSLRGAQGTITKELGGVGTKSGTAFTSSFSRALAPLAGLAVAAVGLGAVTKFIGGSISAASDLQQSLGGVDAIFGKSATQIHDWAKGAQTSVGLSENAYNDLANVIGSQLKNAGTSMDQVGVKTNNLIKQGADLAATFGGTTADAVEAISSALKGERDPIEKYGVSLTQASVDAQAAALGFKKVGGNLSTAGTQAATMALILKQTSAASGQFASQTGTLAEQQQIFGATLENVKAKIGTAFLPAITSVIGALSKGLDPLLTLLQPKLDSFGSKMADVGANISSFFSGLSSQQTSGIPISQPLDAFAAAGARVRDALSASQPVLQTYFNVLSTIAPLIGSAFAQIGPAVGAALAQIGPALAQVIPPLANAVVSLLPALVQLISALAPLIPPLASIIVSLAPVITAISGALAFLVTNILVPLITQLQLGLGAFTALASGMNLTQFAAKAAAGNFGVMLQSGAQLGQGLGNLRVTISKVIGDVILFFARMQANVTGALAGTTANIGGFVGSAISKFGQFVAGVTSKVGQVIQAVASIPAKAIGALGNLGGALAGSGRALIQGFINGITSMFGAVSSAVGGIMDFAKGFFPHSPAKRGPFSGSGWTAVGKSGGALASQFADGFNNGVTNFALNGSRLIPDGFSSALSGSLNSTGQGASTVVMIANKTNVRIEDLIDVRIAKNGEEETRAMRLGYQPAVLGA